MVNIRETITSWLLDEGFEVKKLNVMPPLKIAWGIDVYTPPPMKVNVKIFQPENREDRVILLLGVGISPEHLNELNKLSEKEKLKFSSILLSRLISVCNTCSVAIQPNPVNPQGISIGITLYASDVDEKYKPRFMEKLAVLVNMFLTVVSTFNETFPVLPKEKSKEAGSTTTRM